MSKFENGDYSRERMSTLLADLYNIREVLKQHPFPLIGSLTTVNGTHAVGELITPENNLKTRSGWEPGNHGPFDCSWAMFEYNLSLSAWDREKHIRDLMSAGRVKPTTIMQHRKKHFWLAACAAEYIQAFDHFHQKMLMHTDLDLQNIYVDDNWHIVGTILSSLNKYLTHRQVSLIGSLPQFSQNMPSTVILCFP